MRLQYLESMYRTKQEDVSILSQYLGLTAASNTSENNSALTNFNNVLESLSPESKAIIRNLTMSSSHHRFSSSNLRLPSAYHFLPHLLDDPASLRPAYSLSKGRTGVSIVLGELTAGEGWVNESFGSDEGIICCDIVAIDGYRFVSID